MAVGLDKSMNYQIKRERNLCKYIILKLLTVYLYICKFKSNSNGSCQKWNAKSYFTTLNSVLTSLNSVFAQW